VDQKHERVLRIHFGLGLAEIICVSAFVFELYRALSGNTLSWAYVFEWPLFGAYALYMWRRFIIEETGGGDLAASRRSSGSAEKSEASLAAYNEYLRRVHDHEPHDDSAATALHDLTR
jgi:hypothetical protein